MTSTKTLLNGHRWPVIVAFATMSLIGGITWGFNRTALDFGTQGGYLEPRVVKAGDTVQACFNSITWYRVYPGKTYHWWECQKRGEDGQLRMTRFDMQERQIKIPAGPGKLPPKCRPIANANDEPYRVPAWCEPGLLHYGGYSQLDLLGGWWHLTYDLPPRMDAEIQP